MQDSIDALTAQVSALSKARLLGVRSPSLAQQIGPGPSLDGSRPMTSNGVDAHPALKATLGPDYQPGSFITALVDARGNPDEYARAKAQIAQFGFAWADRPDAGKANLGTSGSTGGYVLPNNIVSTPVARPNTAKALYTSGSNPLLTVITGVAVRGVDLPYRTGAPARMQFQDFGATKENVSEVYGSYTATLGTMARIIDVGLQYLRFSAGAAEIDVMTELTKARDLGENYYVIAGAGTGSVGVGDPTTGIYTALASGVGTYRTAFSAASNSTIAGSAANAFAAGIKALAARSRQPTAIVMDAVSYYTLVTQGADTAGFWMSALLGAGFTTSADGTISYAGVPLLYDPAFDANTSTTKACVIADWSEFRFFRGSEFRIDSSTQAGSRWDQNLCGFRAEQEVAFNASSGVSVGAAQLVTAFIP